MMNIVRMNVTRSEWTPRMPVFANIAIGVARTAD